MSYLFAFYSFVFSILAYLFIVKSISLPVITPLHDLLPFYSPYIFPQSHKLIAYFSAVILIPLSTLILYYIFKKYLRVSRFLSYLSIFLSFAATLFILFSAQAFAYFSSPYFTAIFFLSLICLFYWYFHPRTLKIRTPRPLPAALISFIPFILLIAFTVFDRTMTEKDIFVGTTFQYAHSAVFIGPIFDILNGKVLLVDAWAQYGLILNYIPALVFKFIPLTFTNFFYLMIVFGIIYYLIIFLLLKKIFSGIFWPAVGLTTLFSFHFYATADRFIRPMFFPIRYMLDMPFFLLLWLSNARQKFLLTVLPIYLAFATLYNYETGVSLIISYLLYIFLYSFTQSKSAGWRRGIFLVARQITTILFSLLILGGLYSLYALSATGRLPDWGFALYYVKLYGSGFISSNGPEISLYLFPLTIYFVVIVRTAMNFFEKKLSRENVFHASLAAYGLCLFIYYVERSYPANLASLSIPALILGVWLFKELSEKQLKKIIFLPPFLVLGGFILFGLLYYPVRLADDPMFPYWQGDKNASAKLYTRLEESSAVIAKYAPRAKSVPIISFYDTFYQLKVGKTNSLPYTSYQNIFTRTQADNVLKYISVNRPKYIFTNSEDWPETAVYPEIFDYIGKNYRLVETKELLDVWEKI